MKKNPTSVPSADSTTPPPTEATFRSRASAARVIHSWMSAALTRKLFARQPRHRADDRVLLELQQHASRRAAGCGPAGK